MRLFQEDLKNVYKNPNQKKFTKAAAATAHSHHSGGFADLGHSSGHGGGGDGHGDGTWIYSFADLIMNLLMFFVMMFAISSIDKDKFSKVQEAFSSLSKDANESKVAKEGGQSNYAPTVGVIGNGQNLSNTEILEKIQSLLDMVDKKKIEKSQKSKIAFDSIVSRVSKLSKEAKLEFAADPMGNAFEIVIGSENLFGSGQNSRITKSGLAMLNRIGVELVRYKVDFNVQIRSYLKPSPQINKQSAFLKTSEQASEVMNALQGTILKSRVVDWSIAGYGIDTLSNQENSINKVIIRIAARPLVDAAEKGEVTK